MKFAIIHHSDRQTINEMYENYAPVFILSTGRSGSKFIAALLNASSNITAYHEPRPTLQYFSNYAYSRPDDGETLTRMFDATRMEAILEVFIKDKIYVESNQCLTFFAPHIAALFKRSKFVHLVRHPADFTVSAVRKGWHKNDSIWEAGRIKIADETQWAQMDQIERLAWLWTETNRYIDNFKKILSPARTYTCKFEDLLKETKSVQNLLEFIDAKPIETGKIKELQQTKINELYIFPNEPPNMKKDKDFPPYKKWDKEMKRKLKRYCAEPAKLYGYKL